MIIDFGNCKNNSDGKGFTDAVFMDISKALDSIHVVLSCSYNQIHNLL